MSSINNKFHPAKTTELPKLPSSPAYKKIIVCCDGTSNNEVFPNPITNVSRISRCLTNYDRQGACQITYYQPGVGTGTSTVANQIEGATGRGLYQNLLEAYSFICHNYSWDRKNDDKIYLIGFSRGAFTVRCIAQFINDIGLLQKRGLVHLLDLFALWKEQGEGGTKARENARKSLNKLCDDLSTGRSEEQHLRKGINVEVCAVWDTVGSLGIPILINEPKIYTRKLPFVNSNMCENIMNGIQALSLHERRKPFSPIVWEKPQNLGDRKLTQCWFLGYHSDVGGGNESEGLAHLPLIWMISQLEEHLWFDLTSLWNRPVRKPGDIRTVPHEIRALELADSMQGIYMASGTNVRRPCEQFWHDKGMKKQQDPKAENSHEKMHFSVRALLGQGLCKPCHSLANSKASIVPGENGGEKAVWEFGTSEQSTKMYHVEEDPVSSFELDILTEWLSRDLKEQEDVSQELKGFGDSQEKLSYLSNLKNVVSQKLSVSGEKGNQKNLQAFEAHITTLIHLIEEAQNPQTVWSSGDHA